MFKAYTDTCVVEYSCEEEPIRSFTRFLGQVEHRWGVSCSGPPKEVIFEVLSSVGAGSKHDPRATENMTHVPRTWGGHGYREHGYRFVGIPLRGIPIEV